jgi:hypothetical protein
MIIIGVDFHPEFQQIAWVDTDSGEFQEKRLAHRDEAENFYRALAGHKVRLGMEARGHARWFERLVACLFGMSPRSQTDLSATFAYGNCMIDVISFRYSRPSANRLAPPDRQSRRSQCQHAERCELPSVGDGRSPAQGEPRGVSQKRPDQTLDLPQNGSLLAIAKSFESAMKGGTTADVRRHCAEFVTISSDFYKPPAMRHPRACSPTAKIP